jgi:hypothetical protein
MATEFTKQPPGGTGRHQTPPPPTQQGAPTVLDVAKDSGKAVESKASSALGASVAGVYLTAGQIVQQMPVTTPGPVETAPGDDTNHQVTPPEFPRGAASRHPNVGSAPGPRTKNLAKMKGG